MQSSIVGLSILWGLASFGVQGDFIESPDTASPPGRPSPEWRWKGT